MLCIGLMSGTSMDGIDAALLETDGETNIIELGHVSVPYAKAVKILLKALERAIKRGQHDFEQSLTEYLGEELHITPNDTQAEIDRLTLFLGKPKKITMQAVIHLSTTLHAHAVFKLLQNTNQTAQAIDVIGYHGQTMYHNPSEKKTVQIGDGALLAQLTNITVVNDFRSHDMQQGGQGAPFTPLYHQALAIRDEKIPLAVVNCGGIANITLIKGQRLEDLAGFDTGPGNGLVDALVRERTNAKEFMDTDGQYGLKGKVVQKVLQALFEKAINIKGINYFMLPPPKSLDIRDMVLIQELQSLSLQDACATLEAFTAEMIVKSIDLLQLPPNTTPRHWVLAGGGWNNPVILQELERRLCKRIHNNPIIKTAHEVGWNSQALEAQTFAYFAVRSLKKLPLSVPATTGVVEPSTGGRTYFPPGGPSAKVGSLIQKMR